MSHPLSAVFERCDREAVTYCLLRDAEPLESLDAGGEVDVLVDPHHFDRLSRVLEDAGFVPLASWGRSPHRFFIRYEPHHDRWIKCDVVTAVAFGRPIHHLVTTLGEACLASRRRVGKTFAPGVEDELMTLLLHEMLDRGEFREQRAGRLKALRAQVSQEERIAGHLNRYWPGKTWNELAATIDCGAWDRLLADRGAVAAAIARASASATAARGIRDRVLRTSYRLVGLMAPHAPSVALLAPDGAGKSTLVAGIERGFFGPVCSVYMGLYQKSASTRGRAPGLGLVSLMVTQWRRYLRARYKQASGQLVLFDRYSYDALLPARGRVGLLRRMRRWLLAWTVPGPTLTVILDAPGQLLFSRKGEHSTEILERQRQAYLELSRRLPRTAVVDAQRGPDEVRRAVTRLIWDDYKKRAAS